MELGTGQPSLTDLDLAALEILRPLIVRRDTVVTVGQLRLA